MSYTYTQLVAIAQQNGFTGLSANIIAAIALAESSGDPQASFVNADGSTDRGILQINSFSHAEVPDSCAYDVSCSLQQAYRISNYGNTFTQWVTFNTGAYQQYMNGNKGTSSEAANSSTSTLGLYQDIGGLSQWLANPIRIVKLVVGVGLILFAIVILVLPEATNAVESMVTGNQTMKKETHNGKNTVDKKRDNENTKP